jgi:hypothetical protein
LRTNKPGKVSEDARHLVPATANGAGLIGIVTFLRKGASDVLIDHAKRQKRDCLSYTRTGFDHHKSRLSLSRFGGSATCSLLRPAEACRAPGRVATESVGGQVIPDDPVPQVELSDLTHMKSGHA